MANKGSFLATGQYLSVGDYLVSDNGEFFAVMQSDGNFVLYRGSGPSDNQGYIWSISHTSLPTGQYVAIMQGDGNFVVYQGSDPAHQGTPIWATNTSWVSHRVTTGNSLTADDWMGTNDYLLSPKSALRGHHAERWQLCTLLYHLLHLAHGSSPPRRKQTVLGQQYQSFARAVSCRLAR